MGFLGLFKKKSKAAPPEQTPWTEALSSGFQDQSGFGMEGQRPLQPLEHLRPEETDKPGSINQAEMHTLLVKLDLITTKLDFINQRLAQLELALQGNTQQQTREPVSTPQRQPTQSPYQRW
ncbi:MAG: hypothetical protein AABW64_03240 [Nanoarchaeota archaeon]